MFGLAAVDRLMRRRIKDARLHQEDELQCDRHVDENVSTSVKAAMLRIQRAGTKREKFSFPIQWKAGEVKEDDPNTGGSDGDPEEGHLSPADYVHHKNA